MTTLASNLYLLLAALGLALAASYAGLPVLGQGAFMALGAFGTVHLDRAGWPLGLAVGGTLVLAGFAGYAVAYGAARLSGAYLALATWALAWLAYAVLVAFPGISGGSDGLTRPTPARVVAPALGLGVTLGPAAHVALAVLLCALAMAALARAGRGPGGLDLAAMREGAALADSLGVPVAARRRGVLTITAAVGALAGAGTAVLTGVVAPPDYSPLLSLQLLAAVLLGGTARWWGPVAGVVVLAALPPVAASIARAVGVDPQPLRGALTAALLVGVLALRRPVGRLLAGTSRPTAEPSAGASRRGAGRSAGRLSPAGRGASSPPPAVPLLEARGLEVAYGAVRALDGVDLTVRAGELHAVVGPNGSGKSTLLRVLAGALAPAAGSVAIEGRLRRTPAGQAERVKDGVARTFQRTAAFPGLRPLDQAAIGARAAQAPPYAVLRHLLATPSAHRDTVQRSAVAAAALADCGLTDRAGMPAERLTVGEQRLLQVARVVATGARVLLLDEPAAGMSAKERVRLRGVLEALADSGRAVVLVEHDMALVGRVADRVTVLAGGRTLAEGTPGQVRADPEVRRAYLGGGFGGQEG